jgi:polynucleotide 5'-hydroxyl-kinase GRC3/NOL9
MLFPLEIEVPPQWQCLATRQLSGTVMVIGATDRGKSTLVRWLVGTLCAGHSKVAWLDGDIGQSTMGMPTTMNLAILQMPPLEPPGITARFFVGAPTPRGNMLPILVGLARLHQRAVALGASTVVVDTTGMVAKQSGGGALKQWKIALLRPAHVIALQRERELEHILGPLRREGWLQLHVLLPSDAVESRSPARRAEHRRERFRRYFAGAESRLQLLAGLPVYGRENAGPGRLVALLDADGWTLALGVIEDLQADRWRVITPLSTGVHVAGIQVGAMGIDPRTGKEDR